MQLSSHFTSRLRRGWPIHTLAIGLALLFGLLQPVRLVSEGSPSRQILHAGRILNVRTGELTPDVYLLIENGRIGGIERKAPAGTSVLDLSGLTLLPGLIDCHAHVLVDWKGLSDTSPLRTSSATAAIQGVYNIRGWLEHGFTALRDAGERDPYYAQIAIRDGVGRGLIVGPRMVVAGGPLTVTGGLADSDVLAPDQALPHRPNIADTSAEIEKAVRRDIKYGVDWIKLIATGGIVDAIGNPNSQELSDAQLDAAVETAHRAGRKVMAHAQSPGGIRAAAKAGVDSIEHGSLVDEEGLGMMARRGVWLVPTLYSLEYMIESGLQSGMDEAALEKARLAVKLRRECFARALRSHVKIAFGVDLMPTVLDKEFDAMIRNGMTPLAAIQSATVNAAELLNMSDRIGAIEVGKLADLAGVDGNPLADIKALGRVRFVMKEGRVVVDRPVMK